MDHRSSIVAEPNTSKCQSYPGQSMQMYEILFPPKWISQCVQNSLQDKIKYGGDATVYSVWGHCICGERRIFFMAFKYILNQKLEWKNKHVWLAWSLHFRIHCVWNLKATNMLGSIINMKYVIYWIFPCVWITGRPKYSPWFLLQQSTFKKQKKHDQAEGHLPFLTCKVQHIVPQLPREPATSKKNGNVLKYITTETLDYLN